MAYAGQYPAATGGHDFSGQIFGDYRLIERIGRGGMGDVYRAERADGAFESEVAVKLLRASIDSENQTRRFHRERQLLARLEHPGIARLLDGGSGPQDIPFLVMEWVDGKPITEHIQNLGLSLEARLGLFAEVCRAVAFAHRNLIVHRDLKPSNILVTSDGQVKLLDFGIGKLLSDDNEGGQPLTRTGTVPMTQAYAAPEQILGEPVTTATDVFALGVVLFEMVTGERPHRRDAAAPATLAAQVNAEEVTRPSDRVRRQGSGIAAKRLAKHLRGDLDTIVLTALKREPARRYASAEALLEDLKRHADGLPIHARPDTAAYRIGKFARRHRIGVAASALIIMTLIGALTVSLWQAGMAREAAGHARQQANAAEQTRDFLVDLFADSDIMRNPAGAELTVAELLMRATDRLETSFQDQPATRAEIAIVLARALHRLGRQDTAEELANSIIEKIGVSGIVDPTLLGKVYGESASIFIERGQWDRAESILKAGLAMLEPSTGAPPVVARLSMLENLSSLEYRLGNRPERRLWLQQELVREYRKVYEPNAVELITPLANLASAYGGMQLDEESESSHREAWRIASLHFPPRHVRMMSLQIHRGGALLELGNLRLAREELEHAAELSESSLPEDHPIRLQLLLVLGTVYEALSESEKAAQKFEEALKLARRLNSERELRYAHFFRAPFALRQGWWGTAQEDIRSFLGPTENSLDSRSSAGRFAMMGMNTFINEKCDLPVDSISLIEVIDQIDTRFPHDSRLRVFTRCLLAAQEDGTPHAFDLHQEARAILAEVLPADHFRRTDFDRYCTFPSPETSCGRYATD